MSNDDSQSVDRDAIAEEYFGLLAFSPYPVQVEALLAWFTSEQGVLVCAPTGTGKTLIAEAAIYESLRTGRQCYYTTPLIALSDQKLNEFQASAARWGFRDTDIGLITGNRRVNPDATVLVVVAEILLNRLLHPDAFDMSHCHAVVMDEFHSFNDADRGIVWELTLGMLPAHVRTMLLSATVGNSYEFNSWLNRSHGRRLQLVQGTERKVPLRYEWIDDAYLDEHLERISEGDEVARRTPGLIFCFNRDQCWQVAELLKGKKLIDKQRQSALSSRLEAFDWSQGAGPKLKSLLQRGVGIHHAGILPRYRRIVETLFEEKLLSVAVCTETLSAGINLPARSIILPTILKGPRDRKKVIEPSAAHQIFGRAGRPQFDKEGFVYALAHEDDVKHLRWKLKYDSIPEDTKDPGLLRAKKQLKKKMPKRRAGETYWTAGQFESLRVAPAANLSSRGDLPWRLLTYLLTQIPNIKPIRELVAKRLMSASEIQVAQRHLTQMLIVLHRADFLSLDPPPKAVTEDELTSPQSQKLPKKKKESVDEIAAGLFAKILAQQAAFVAPRQSNPDEEVSTSDEADSYKSNGQVVVPSDELIGASETTDDASEDPETMPSNDDRPKLSSSDDDEETIAAIQSTATTELAFDLEEYDPQHATVSAKASALLQLRSVNPMLGVYFAENLVNADLNEKILALESLLELPKNIARLVPVPHFEELPWGPLAVNTLHPRLLELGLVTSSELTGMHEEEQEEASHDISDHALESLATGRERPKRKLFYEPPPRRIELGEKLLRLFHHDVPGVGDARIQDVWVVGELLSFEGNFNKYITARSFQRQEGILFRHVLRFIMLCGEFASIPPAVTRPEEWENVWDDLATRLMDSCRVVDPQSTEEFMTTSKLDDLVTNLKAERSDRS